MIYVLRRYCFFAVFAVACLLACGCKDAKRKTPCCPVGCRPASVLCFTASWCGPCRYQEPAVERLAQSVRVDKIDIDANRTMAEKFGIRSVPTYIVIDGGREVFRTHAIGEVVSRLRRGR